MTRASLDYTAAQVADLLGVSQQQVNLLCKLGSEPTTSALAPSGRAGVSRGRRSPRSAPPPRQATMKPRKTQHPGVYRTPSGAYLIRWTIRHPSGKRTDREETLETSLLGAVAARATR